MENQRIEIEEGVKGCQEMIPANTLPKGYLITSYEIIDHVIHENYLLLVATLRLTYNAKLVLHDEQICVMEGKPNSVISIIEFTSKIEATEFYNTAEYITASALVMNSPEDWVLIAENSISKASIKPEEPSAGYLIANYSIHDEDNYKEYVKTASAFESKYEGKAIIYDAHIKTLTGSPKEVIAIAIFPTFKHAQRFYDSHEYTDAKQFRIASTEGWVMLSNGGMLH